MATQPTRYTLAYDLIVPAWIGGANRAAEFRIESYARKLRGWFRFLAFGKFGSEEIASFWDAVLFGWPKRPFGEGHLTFRLTRLEKQDSGSPWCNFDEKWPDWSGLNYLTAQGLTDRKRCPVSGFEVSASLSALKTAPFEAFLTDKNKFLKARLDLWPIESESAVAVLEDAMMLIGLIGGLGARERRGFGSLAIESFERGKTSFSVPKNIAEYKELISSIYTRNCWTDDGIPPREAVCKMTQTYVCCSDTNIVSLMNEIGFLFMAYRSYGHRINRHDPSKGHIHEFRSQNARARYWAGKQKRIFEFSKRTLDDHDDLYCHLSDRVLQEGSKDNRAAFGLPHNYGSHRKVGLGEKTTRRPSGLLFHFHRFGKQFIFSMSVLPSAFMPQDESLFVDRNGRISPLLPLDEKWWVYPAEFADYVRNPQLHDVNGIDFRPTFYILNENIAVSGGP
jgi:CRISPR-associated protein Cmr1